MSDLKMGDIIEVGSDFKNKRKFIKHGKKGSAICVDIDSEDEFEHGKSFETFRWPTWRIPKEPEYISFTYDDYRLLIGKAIKDKRKKGVLQITNIGKEYINSGHGNISFLELLDDYEFINLETKETFPCGKLKDVE